MDLLIKCFSFLPVVAGVFWIIISFKKKKERKDQPLAIIFTILMTFIALGYFLYGL